MAISQVIICDNPHCGSMTVIDGDKPIRGIKIEKGELITGDQKVMPFGEVYACTTTCLEDAVLNVAELTAKAEAAKPKRGRPKGSGKKPADATTTVVIHNPPALVEPEVKA